MSSTPKYIDDGCERYIAHSKDVEKSYIEACEWISSLGIDYKKTRFGEYERDVENFIKNKGKTPAEESIKIFNNAQMEASELIRLKETFDNFSTDEIIDSIKKTTSGQRFRNASSKDQSRDFAFELGVASRFIRAGYSVDLRGVSDLVATIDGRKLYVECKRLKSYSQLEKRVKAANTQITNRLKQDKSSKSRGMIALNITDIINADAKMIISETIEQYQKASAETLKDFVLKHRKTLSEKKQKKHLGVLTEFTTQGIIFDGSKENFAFANIREGNIYQYPLKQEEEKFLESFRGKLGDQNIYK
ncbi:hypothetical protein M3P05_20450 [Sansalvadorimonas sp. 2012CJ34-2]|uniref:Uncharacterized protein n=1 Tax=Parendozoicomonas callyspongiae TaxID=2942213 RepID=A0ABT0PLM5_9GAMM|nr:hypothetical protein [Sansalvadorimonas sp. 2012CJ34-2]MCL6272290.1 hypothetical protein [Sansalvadorimonas sp. 2012CJ34-2]